MKGCGDGAPEVFDVDGLGEAVVRAARSLKRLDLLTDIHGATDDHDRDMGKGLLELREVVETQVAVVEDMIEDNDVGCRLGEESEGFPSGSGTEQFEVGEGVLVDLRLQVVVLDDEDARFLHGRGMNVGGPGASGKVGVRGPREGWIDVRDGKVTVGA